MALGRRPTTDTGTVILHAILVVTFVILLATGLRIASDDPAAMWLARLDAVLPMENIWYRHLVSAVIFTAALTGYIAYVLRARLSARVRLDRARLGALKRPGRARWSAVNVLVYWALMASLLVEIASGALLFLDTGGASLAVHLETTWLLLGLVGAHIVLHGASGGVGQLARVLRPAPLAIAPPPPDLAELLAEQLRLKSQAVAGAASERDEASPHADAAPRRKSGRLQAHPAVTAFVVACSLSGLALGVESATRQTLVIAEVPAAEAPVLDGDLSDPVWRKARPVTLMTTQGGDFGGGGESLVEVRAVHDGEIAYFAFVWTDPTRSLKHLPLVKTAAGWSVAATDHDKGDETRFHEDKFAVLFTRPTLPLIGAAIHLSPAPRPDRPASTTGRGLHYTPDGSLADVWVWRASHQGPIGHVDNCHFGGAAPATQQQRDGRARYPGGFSIDPGVLPYRSNVEVRADAGGRSQTLPLRLPRSIEDVARRLGRVSDSVHESESEGARWWMTERESSPYTPADDQRLPPGTIIPGILMDEQADGGRASIRGVARWAAGRWTLEIARRLHTGSEADLPIKSGHLMWVAAFDHSETRHTRHLRPLRLEVE